MRLTFIFYNDSTFTSICKSKKNPFAKHIGVDLIQLAACSITVITCSALEVPVTSALADFEGPVRSSHVDSHQSTGHSTCEKMCSSYRMRPGNPINSNLWGPRIRWNGTSDFWVPLAAFLLGLSSARAVFSAHSSLPMRNLSIFADFMKDLCRTYIR